MELHAVEARSLGACRRRGEESRQDLRKLLHVRQVKIVDTLAEQVGRVNRIFVLPDALAQPAAYTLVNILERGRFPTSPVQSNTTDLARALYTATERDLFLSIEVSGDVPHLAKTLSAAKEKGCKTAAIISAASLRWGTGRDLAVFMSGAVLGILTLDTTKVVLAARIRPLLDPKILGPLYRICGVLLIAFGVRMVAFGFGV